MLFLGLIIGTVVGFFVCSLLNASKSNDITYDGSIVITEREDAPKLFSLELEGDPEELEKKESVVFKIVPGVLED